MHNQYGLGKNLGKLESTRQQALFDRLRDDRESSVWVREEFGKTGINKTRSSVLSVTRRSCIIIRFQLSGNLSVKQVLTPNGRRGSIIDTSRIQEVCGTQLLSTMQ